MRNRSARVFLAVCLSFASLLVAAAPVQSPEGQWQQYSYAADGFAISAPAQPAFTRQNKDTATGPVEMHNYAIELGNNSGVMISTAQFQGQGNASTKAVLQKAKEGAIAAVNARLTSEHEITLQGVPGLEFEAANDQFHTRVRMYFVNARLITMMAIAPLGTDIPAGAARVFSSFKILK